jgi:hypothetical protein
MNPVSLLQSHYGWTPSSRQVFKKPVPTDSKCFRVPQTNGVPGWIALTYDKLKPVCFWVTSTETTRIPCIADERIFGDTIFRAERIGQLEFVISDIFIYNSNCIFACSTFEQRYVWLSTLLKSFTFSSTGTIKFIHKCNLDPKQKLRGYEDHIDKIGSNGFFVELEDPNLVEIIKLAIPDCYRVQEGYLKVPDLKTSVYLRSKGDKFKCRCRKNEDGSWSLLENIPSID